MDFKTHALNYVKEVVKPGASQNVVDSIKEIIIHANNRLTSLKDDLMQREKIQFAKSFENINKGIFDFDIAMASQKSLVSLEASIKGLNDIKSILEEALEIAKSEKDDSIAKALANLIDKAKSE